MRRARSVVLAATALVVSDVSAEQLDQLLEQRLNSEAASISQSEQAGIAKGRREATLAEGEGILAQVGELYAIADRWETQMRETLTNEAGRALGRDSNNVEDFMQLQDSPRLSLEQIDGWRRQVQSLLLPLQTASDGSLYSPSETLIVELRTVAQQVAAGRQDYQRLQAKWRTLMQRAPAGTGAATAPTLAERLDQIQDERAKNEWGTLQRARNQALMEQQQQLAAAEVERIALETKLKRQAIEEENRSREAEAQRQRTAEAQARLVAQAMSPETLQRFQPFLAPGRRQLARDSCRWGGEYLERQPVSYSDMMKCKTLTDVQRFVKHANGRNNDRPKWPVPTTEADWADMKRRLEDFKTYVSIWLDQGVLAQ